MSARLGQVKSHIDAQVSSAHAQRELSNFGPAETDWNALVRDSVDRLVPKLVESAPALVERLQLVFQGPMHLKRLSSSPDLQAAFRSMKQSDPKSHKAIVKFQRNCTKYIDGAVELVSTYLVAQQVTKVIEDFLPSPNGLGDSVIVNGSSIYPDLYLADRVPTYGELPQQRKGGSTIHGPCRNSRNQPSKVPDGLEVKTKRGKAVRVDCHSPNPGLHLVVTWSTQKKALQINDVWLAYIRVCDYTECARNTDATTVKFSFGQTPFISLLRETS